MTAPEWSRHCVGGGRAALLLQEMRDIPEGARTARYRAVVAVADPLGHVALFDGRCEGAIGRHCQGARGFGYDPVFVLADGRTAAQLADGEKDTISHRGQAVRAAAAYLRSLGE